MPTEVTFQIGPALIAGLIASFVVIVLVIGMLAIAPTRFPLNPLYLIGSSISIDTTLAYGIGLILLLVTGTAYGIFVAAVFTGFEVENLEFLWGAVTGLALSIVTGTTLAYARNLNRAVRAGQVGDPGPFLVRYGNASAVQLVFGHALFGSITGVLYALFS